MDIHIHLNDLFKMEELDVLVIPTSPLMQLEGPVGGTAYHLCSQEVFDEIDKKTPLPIGEIILLENTNAHNQHMILVCNAKKEKNEDVFKVKQINFLKSIVRKCIICAKEHNFKHIGFPLLSSGTYKFGINASADCIYDVFKEFAEDPSDLTLHMVFYYDHKDRYFDFRKSKCSDSEIEFNFQFNDFNGNDPLTIPRERKRGFEWMKSDMLLKFSPNTKSGKFADYFYNVRILHEVRDIDVYVGVCSKSSYDRIKRGEAMPTRQQAIGFCLNMKMSVEEINGFLSKIYEGPLDRAKDNELIERIEEHQKFLRSIK